MKRFMSFILIVSLGLLIGAEAFAQNLPISRQASLVERVSSAEVMIEATGIYVTSETRSRRIERDLSDNGVPRATNDAKKAAIWFLLYGSTDPMLNNQQAQNNFRPHEAYFFDLNNINRWITWEQSGLQNRARTADGNGIQITKRFRINTDMIRSDLERFGVISSRVELSDAIGRPFIMVLPQAPTGTNPVDLLRNDSQKRHAASVVESFLTARRYDVLVPEQITQLDDMIAALNLVEGQEDDYAFRIAQQIGSDVYITFSSTVEDAGYGTQRVAMQVRAYETTTGRLLGTETGYSQGRRGEVSVSIEESMNEAIDNVLNRINNYWIEDRERGVQFKVVLNIPSSFDRDEVEEIQFAFMDAMEQVTRMTRENVATSQTLDLLAWVDQNEHSNSRNFYRALNRAYTDNGGIGRIRSVTINRKLLLLEVEP